MEKTLKLLKTIIEKDETTKEDKILIQEYQKSLKPSILACFYERYYKLFISIGNKFVILSSEDKASFILEELDKALQNYNLIENTKFSTYLTTCLKNRFKMEIESLNTHKRKTIYNLISYENMVENGFDIESNVGISILDIPKLTDKQNLILNLLYKGYSLTDIAKKLNTTTQNIYNIRNKIQKKFISESLIN